MRLRSSRSPALPPLAAVWSNMRGNRRNNVQDCSRLCVSELVASYDLTIATKTWVRILWYAALIHRGTPFVVFTGTLSSSSRFTHPPAARNQVNELPDNVYLMESGWKHVLAWMSFTRDLLSLRHGALQEEPERKIPPEMQGHCHVRSFDKKDCVVSRC